MKKILISRTPWQVRAAIIDDGKLQDVYFDSHTTAELERCFFKGKISKLLPGLQTAFVDIGQPKAGFLHISEVDRVLAAEKIADSLQAEGIEHKEYTARTVKKVMDIGKVFHEEEDVLVQVIKEPHYEKGAKLTTCFTLPGKFIVLMPNISQIGVSKKIEQREERARLREIVTSNLPKGMGAIVRTTSENRPAGDIKRDISVLVSSWHAIQKKFAKAKAGECLFTDLPLSLRVVREHLNEEVEAVVVDDPQDRKTVYKFIRNLTPEFAHKVMLYNDDIPLFERYDIDKQLHNALQRKVFLKSGGSLIIETTEAMTVIDVNTGRYTGGNDSLEETILKTNLEAAEEIVRQLRLRNIGGLIVIDFIDMAPSSHRQRLSHTLEKTLKQKDKFQSVTLKVSEFGLVQMTRKRSGKTLVQQLMRTCQQCGSLGYVKSTPTLTYELFDECVKEVKQDGIKPPYLLIFSPHIFHYIVHHEYQSIVSLEKLLNGRIVLECDDSLEDDEYRIETALDTHKAK